MSKPFTGASHQNNGAEFSTNGAKRIKLNSPVREPFTVKVIGKDKAVYSLEIFMRDPATCLDKNDKARKSDPPCPIIYDKNGKPNAIIPANHKILIYCQRTAVKPNQWIPRGSYVLFKFFVDGEGLSDGVLHQASEKAPDIHGAKARIDTHSVKDDQTVEEANEANPFIGTFVVKVFTTLMKTTVKEGFQALPEDDRVHEKTKRRIVCAIDKKSGHESSSRKVEEYEDGTPGLVEVGEPQATLYLIYDDLVGTRARHLYEKAFQIDKMREAGVSEAMLREAFPGGVPVAIADGTVINLDDDYIKEESVDIKEESVDIKEENIDIKEENIDIKEETIDVKAETVDVKEETVDIKEETVDIKEENFDIKEEKEDLDFFSDNPLPSNSMFLINNQIINSPFTF